MSPFLYPVYAAACLLLLVVGIRLFRANRHASTAFALLVVIGVGYDNAILAVGNLAGEGDLLAALSLPRFVLHQLALPWIIVGGWDLARQAGQGWARRRWAGPAAIALALVVMTVGIVTRVRPLHLEPEMADGVLRYVAIGLKGPPLVSIVSIAFVGIVGLVAWRQLGWPWLALASIAVFIAEGVPVEAFRRAVGSAFEVAFLAALLLTQHRLDTGRLNPAPTDARMR